MKRHLRERCVVVHAASSGNHVCGCLVCYDSDKSLSISATEEAEKEQLEEPENE